MQVIGDGIGEQLARPDRLTRRAVEAVEPSEAANCVDTALGNGRRGARAVAAFGFVKVFAIAMLPDRAAGGRLVADGAFHFAALFLRQCVVADDGERRPARADRPAPKLLRRMIGPVVRKMDTGNL